MWFWIIAGIVVLAVAVRHWRGRRRLKASGSSLGGIEARAVAQRGRDEGRFYSEF